MRCSVPLSVCFCCLPPPEPQEGVVRANPVHPFSKHLLSTAWVLETHVPQPLPLPPRGKLGKRLILHPVLGGEQTKQMGKEGGGIQENQNRFNNSQLQTFSRSVTHPLCGPQPLSTARRANPTARLAFTPLSCPSWWQGGQNSPGPWN